MSEIENALNFPTQAQIQKNAEEFGIPLQFPDVGRLPADIRLSEGIKTQKTTENTVQNEGVPEYEDIIKRDTSLKTSSFSSLR
ncbi:MAG: hypothetical protein KBD23_03220 [Gammaproteobacteria bacterium]|nr:hypothetical protein [Gammaproteobacteria bacterium]MBP9729137.1 hypothetical protein [Gammaproteobacteria bacterium]